MLNKQYCRIEVACLSEGEGMQATGNDSELMSRLMRAGVVLNIETPPNVSGTLAGLIVMATGRGSTKLQTSEREIASVAGLDAKGIGHAVDWLQRAGYLKKDAPRGSGPKFYCLDLPAMERAAVRIRLQHPKFSQLLEEAGCVLPLPPVRKRKRPVAA